MGTTVTWLMALHLIFTYVPKAIDAVQGIQQIEKNRSGGNNPFSGAKGISVKMHKVGKKAKQ